MAHQSLLCYRSLRSIPGAVECDFVPSIGVHPEHRVTSDHEYQLELGCFGSDHHHLFSSFDSYCAVYALIRNRRDTRVLFLSVYLAYKEVSYARIKNNRKV